MNCDGLPTNDDSFRIDPQHLESTMFVYNDLISVKCNIGFQLTEGIQNSSIKCDEKGEWKLDYPCHIGNVSYHYPACLLHISEKCPRGTWFIVHAKAQNSVRDHSTVFLPSVKSRSCFIDTALQGF